MNINTNNCGYINIISHFKNTYTKRLQLIILILFFTTIANGQAKKLSIGFVYSPDRYSYKFADTLDTAGLVFNLVKPNTYKVIKNYSFGIDLQYNFNKRFGITTELCYSTKSFIQKYIWLISPYYPYNPGIPEHSIINVAYLDIPIIFKYYFLIGNKLTAHVSAGIITGFLLSENEELFRSNKSTAKEDFFTNQIHIKATKILSATEILVGANFNMGKKVFLSFEPYFRYGINKIYDSSSSTYPVSYGLFIGIHYKII